MHNVPGRRWAALVLSVAIPVLAEGQDRLKTTPGYERAGKVSRDGPSAAVGGALSVVWSDDGRAFEYDRGGKRFRYDVEAKKAAEVIARPNGSRGSDRLGRSGSDAVRSPERGRQFETATSPNSALTAFYRDRNLWVSAADGTGERAITTDGSVAGRMKYGSASWVYGEELSQHKAMWWSPDSRKLAYYRFDERGVRDYYVAMHQTDVQATLDTEAYPKPGTANPIVDLYIYDIATRKSVRVDVRSGRPFDNTSVGHYVYRVEWSADGRELIFLRTNRRQNIMEVAAADPLTGATRVVLRDEWTGGWIMSEPRMVFLADGRRFIWESQRNGWNNFYLYDLGGRLVAPLTASTTYEAASLVKIDERAGVVFYTARDGDNSLKLQLHRVALDGRGDRRLTDPAFHHTIGGCIPGLGSRPEQPAVAGTCAISPDNRYFVDVYETHDTPPATRLADATSGAGIAPLTASDTTTWAALGGTKAELFTFVAADGKTPLHGLVQFPAAFDPARRYPALVNVYGGPEFATGAARETFVAPDPLAEYGFLLVYLDSRAVPGLGKRALDALYRKLGQADVDDIAEGVKALAARPYFDRARVGIFGTSYGGYMAAMALLRHPDVFAAASASSAPTDWRNYDTIYAERYMGLPQDDKAGYDLGSAMPYAKDLKGRLLLYYGTADNNVHPSNTLQLIKALQEAGKSFDVQVGPDRGHSAVNADRMMEFFIEALHPGV
jgi:dipeptidyl-peptidase-4